MAFPQTSQDTPCLGFRFGPVVLRDVLFPLPLSPSSHSSVELIFRGYFHRTTSEYFSQLWQNSRKKYILLSSTAYIIIQYVIYYYPVWHILLSIQYGIYYYPVVRVTAVGLADQRVLACSSFLPVPSSDSCGSCSTEYF
jgi:hypothetical protein